MADEKVYEPETIQDEPLPGQEQQYLSVSTPTTGGVTEPSKITNNRVPTKRIAVELLSTQLNTKSKKVLGEFVLVDQGAFRVGKYENGVSGEVVLTPDGMTAKNKSGNTTFSLDGDTGDATFAGQLQAGALISGAVYVGDSDIVIDGDNKVMIFYADDGLPAIVIGEV